MVIIQGVLVDTRIFSKSFVCHLAKCKGACCHEGDYGAPLSDQEIEELDDQLNAILPFLPDLNQEKITEQGFHQYFPDMHDTGTALMNDRSCVFMSIDENGVAQCGIEKAEKTGATKVQKPLSCQLYPIRIRPNEQSGLDKVEYDDWDICSPACALGKQLGIPVYEFVKNAIVRKYGSSFYEELDAFAKQYDM